MNGKVEEKEEEEESKQHDPIIVDSDGNTWHLDPRGAYCEFVEHPPNFCLLGVTKGSYTLYTHPLLCVFSIFILFFICFLYLFMI